MKKAPLSIAVATAIALAFAACQNGTDQSTAKTDTTAAVVAPKPLRDKVMTADDQKALTPDMVIQNLKDGNSRFMANDLTRGDYPAMVKHAASDQYPEAVVLSCLDSRVLVEEVFDKSIGDLFVGRIAGNIVDVDMLGSMEFGCKLHGAKVIVVLGHGSCGAIKGAIDNAQMGNLTAMLSKIRPAVKKSADFKGEKTSKNDAYVEYVAKNNVLNTIEEIKSKSPILKEMADKGEIRIVGAYYDINTGAVTFL